MNADDKPQMQAMAVTSSAHTSGWLQEPDNNKDSWKMCEAIANTSMCPASYRGKTMEIMLCLDHGARLGLPPLMSLHNIAVINGRPTLYGDGLLAVLHRHPEFEDMHETYDPQSRTATCIIKRRGKSPATASFSWEMAERAQLTRKDTWKYYPERMLQWRARGWAVRDVFADALMGLITEWEADDIAPREAVLVQDAQLNGKESAVEKARKAVRKTSEALEGGQPQGEMQ